MPWGVADSVLTQSWVAGDWFLGYTARLRRRSKFRNFVPMIALLFLDFFQTPPNVPQGQHPEGSRVLSPQGQHPEGPRVMPPPLNGALFQ